MKNLIIVSLIAVITLASCTDSDESKSASPNRSEKPVVHTTNYPLAYFAKRIAGDAIDLNFLPGNADGDPAFWEPTEDDIAKLQAADLILLNGATYEKWIDHVSLPSSTQVDTSTEIAAWFIEIKETGTHSHGAGGDHSHDGTAFTTWLDMGQANEHAKAVQLALADLLPDSKTTLEENAAKLFGDLDQLHEDLKAITAKIGEQPLVASHPVYHYLARDYGLKIESVVWEPETVPNEDGMAELQKILGDHPAKVMIWEGEPATESVAKLKALGIESVVFDPCGNQPDEGDFLSVMRQNLENLTAIQ